MTIIFSLADFFQVPVSMMTALIASTLIGLTSGMLGSFIVLRRLSLMGDALSHAVLPGVAISYLLGIPMMIGATFFGVLAAALIEFITKKSTIKTDSSIGIILSSFFALGVILISRAQSGTDLNHILFGNVLAVTPSELLQSLIILAVVFLLVTVFYQGFFISSFDPVVAKSYGINTNVYHYLLMILLTIFTVSALSQVGIVMVIALLVTPAATMYLWVKHLKHMMIGASILGVLMGILGVLISFHYDFPTSSTIVLVGAFFFLVSFICSPKNNFIKRKEKIYEKNSLGS
ncbi:metal ABC transporter permease [Vagococcus xieshaowenii]|uniref:Manganese import system permease protein ScaB n=1 Tax=Vagococcus xieshaowenii TaxID=2562451 RepID=A0AAJ5EE20_9ENTE|nr:metal ABC transporter permease [Vagococcus xieshaowenii]QCA29176.1 metal ABC transporter permease [Vagococcus xieshaowenii]TFZ40846.1 metal ABC transporter permease [Vagococcus xieshaowenii]